jgi:hypothetical protein
LWVLTKKSELASDPKSPLILYAYGIPKNTIKRRKEEGKGVGGKRHTIQLLFLRILKKKIRNHFFPFQIGPDSIHYGIHGEHRAREVVVKERNDVSLL